MSPRNFGTDLRNCSRCDGSLEDKVKPLQNNLLAVKLLNGGTRLWPRNDGGLLVSCFRAQDDELEELSSRGG